MNELATLLRAAGLQVTVGTYAIRISDCDHFVIQNYGGDICEPSIDADADSVADMERDARMVSRALAKAGIVHRFEIYDERNTLAAYLHHNWPEPTPRHPS
jgi:hypothetical protein